MRISVLDHGYVEFIEAWGHGKAGCEVEAEKYGELQGVHDYECGIIEAARQSTQGSFRGWNPADCDCNTADCDLDIHPPSCASRKSPGDAKLLRYLYQHNHQTPFEFAGMVIEVQAPIFVFREWHRHRTQSYNEMSARYEPLPNLYYVPSVERVMMAGGSNKQAAGIRPIDELGAQQFISTLQLDYEEAERSYQDALANGVPKELARCMMPVGHYSRMRASANLRNWLAFMTLRCDPAAQWEIRRFANAVAEIIGRHFPRTYKMWCDPSQVGGKTL